MVLELRVVYAQGDVGVGMKNLRSSRGESAWKSKSLASEKARGHACKQIGQSHALFWNQIFLCA